MAMLFKKCFFSPIRCGTKTQTIRWWRRPMVRPGQLAAVPFLGGRLRIDAVEPLAGLDDLTESDASADGFPSRSTMVAALRFIYPELCGAGCGVDRRLFRVRFHFVANGACQP